MSLVVYTAILGGCDRLKPAPSGAGRCVCFSGDPAHLDDPQGWDVRAWPIRDWAATDSPRRDAWALRCLPHVLFTDAPLTVWIDASFTLTDLPRLLRDAGQADIAALRHHTRASCYDEATEIVKVGQADAGDVQRQMDAYRRVGYAGTPLSISCILVRRHTPAVTAFNETWANEIGKHPGDNTQLSLDYSAWMHGLQIAPLSGTRHANPYATHDHSDHKRRRQPYDTAVMR